MYSLNFVYKSIFDRSRIISLFSATQKDQKISTYIYKLATREFLGTLGMLYQVWEWWNKFNNSGTSMGFVEQVKQLVSQIRLKKGSVVAPNFTHYQSLENPNKLR